MSSRHCSICLCSGHNRSSCPLLTRNSYTADVVPDFAEDLIARNNIIEEQEEITWTIDRNPTPVNQIRVEEAPVTPPRIARQVTPPRPARRSAANTNNVNQNTNNGFIDEENRIYGLRERLLSSLALPLAIYSASRENPNFRNENMDEFIENALVLMRATMYARLHQEEMQNNTNNIKRETMAEKLESFECSICYEDVNTDIPETKYCRLNCNHSFCNNCVSSQLDTGNNCCALCRTQIQTIYSNSTF